MSFTIGNTCDVLCFAVFSCYQRNFLMGTIKSYCILFKSKNNERTGQHKHSRHKIFLGSRNSKSKSVSLYTSVLTVLKYSTPQAWKLAAISGVVTTAATGCPLPMGLPMVTMSGATPETPASNTGLTMLVLIFSATVHLSLMLINH